LSDKLPNVANGETWMAFYVRKRKFAECMILGWQSVEYYVNQMILQEFDLPYLPKEEPRADFILENVGFRTKLKFLKDMGRLSQPDCKTILDFYDERNKLFHGKVFIYHPTAVPEEEKTRLMELAKKASQIVVNRGFEVWVDEGTGDIGNKNIPKSNRPKGVKKLN
jgi:hypothetical protein